MKATTLIISVVCATLALSSCVYLPIIRPFGNKQAPYAIQDLSFFPNNDLLVVTYDGGSRNLMRVAVDTGEWTTLSRGQSGDDYDPGISPDGSKIAFCRKDSSGDANLFLLDLESGATTRLTELNARVYAPRFSPDGSKIVFSSTSVGRSSKIGILDLATKVYSQIYDCGRCELYGAFLDEAGRVTFAKFYDWGRNSPIAANHWQSVEVRVFDPSTQSFVSIDNEKYIGWVKDIQFYTETRQALLHTFRNAHLYSFADGREIEKRSFRDILENAIDVTFSPEYDSLLYIDISWENPDKSIWSWSLSGEVTQSLVSLDSFLEGSYFRDARLGISNDGKFLSCLVAKFVGGDFEEQVISIVELSSHSMKVYKMPNPKK